MDINQYSNQQLQSWEQELGARYRQIQGAGLKLDLTRGKPSTAQVTLADGLDGVLAGDFLLPDGTDTRNYGGLEGIMPARELGGEILGVAPELVLAGDNSSLTLMYHYLLHAYFYGVRGPDSAWRHEENPKFIALVPGYDRHFGICEDLGIQMINVGFTDKGPDMDRVEALVRDDPSIKGMWCVPKYSNPTGHTYSDAVVARIAALGTVAGPHFRIIWDNAYAVHDLDDTPPRLINLMDLARQQGTEDTVVMVASTSKITFAGAGVAFLASSAENLKAFKKHLGVFSIGPDKVNQLRHVRFLQGYQGLRAHMRRHAELVRPKFELVDKHLEEALGGTGMGAWTRPRGGYFVSFDAHPGLAREIIRLAGEAGVKLTPAGATFPYGKDPEDCNIRLAPTYPSLEELDQAMGVFTLCVKLATARQRLGKV